MKWLLLIVGLVLILLGGIWFLQGTGMVTMAPILCVAECEPFVGGSPTWAVTGLVALVLGVAALWSGVRRFRAVRGTR